MPRKSQRQTPLMRFFSTLAGPLVAPKHSKQNGKVQVSYLAVNKKNGIASYIWSYVIALCSLLFTILLATILLMPNHWEVRQNTAASWLDWIMLLCLMLMQFFIIISTLTAARSTVKSRDPIPLKPIQNKRIAFATTRAPGEPVAMAVATLQAAKRIRYRSGCVDVWLLDETDDPELRTACAEIGIHYFTRRGVAKWNHEKSTISKLAKYRKLLKLRNPEKSGQYNPLFAARTKHGNFNAWMDYLQREKIYYDFLAGVDTDQIPEPNYLERTLGYFHDDDVAFVVGPQVYGNYSGGLNGLVVRFAESQASFFQSTLQRAANADSIPMFVGTNYVIRMRVLLQINGFQACITEDMATSLTIHSQKNPTSGNHWKSVYTPDVLAVGEGPEFWGPYFTQQWRWAAGAMDTWRRVVWRVFHKLPGQAKVHYPLMLFYYPMAAMTWIVGMVSSSIYLLFGATAVNIPWHVFISLYTLSLCMQLNLYFWNRQHNVSPHEPRGSYGIAGLIVSALATPVYFAALVSTISGKKARFVVTTKGTSNNPDWLPTFKIHFMWGIITAIILGVGIVRGNTHPAILTWGILQLLICIVPPILGLSLAIPSQMKNSPLPKSIKQEGPLHA